MWKSVVLALMAFSINCQGLDNSCNYWKKVCFEISNNRADIVSGVPLVNCKGLKGKNIHLNFINNPFGLDSTNDIVLLLGKHIIYECVYDDFILVRIPFVKINKQTGISIHIKKDNKYYSLTYNMEVFTIKKKDNLLHFIFIPDKEPAFYVNSTESDRF